MNEKHFEMQRWIANSKNVDEIQALSICSFIPFEIEKKQRCLQRIIQNSVNKQRITRGFFHFCSFYLFLLVSKIKRIKENFFQIEF